MTDELKECPSCESPYAYALRDDLYACPACGFEWQPSAQATSDEPTVLDVNGNPLSHGDSVIVVKNLPVKGAPKPIKAGTKVKNIRLVDGDHNIDCKIKGFGPMKLKSEFVKKA